MRKKAVPREKKRLIHQEKNVTLPVDFKPQNSVMAKKTLLDEKEMFIILHRLACQQIGRASW